MAFFVDAFTGVCPGVVLPDDGTVDRQDAEEGAATEGIASDRHPRRRPVPVVAAIDRVAAAVDVVAFDQDVVDGFRVGEKRHGPGLSADEDGVSAYRQIVAAVRDDPVVMRVGAFDQVVNVAVLDNELSSSDAILHVGDVEAPPCEEGPVDPNRSRRLWITSRIARSDLSVFQHGPSCSLGTVPVIDRNREPFIGISASNPKVPHRDVAMPDQDVLSMEVLEHLSVKRALHPP